MDELSYYELLKVPPDADSELIRARYRALQGVYHPDRPYGDALVSRQLNDYRLFLLEVGADQSAADQQHA